MGNRLCKRKTDVVDGSSNRNQTPFDRIITRLHLRPTSWKSDSYLNQKQVNRQERSSKSPTESSNQITHSQQLSKSSDWTDVSLEVPDKDEHVHLRNPKLALIFNNEDGTPTPPPRKNKRNFREKIEAVAKSGLQALQPKNKQQSQQPVEEPLFTKKKINYNCPICDSDEKNHNRDHHHHSKQLVPSATNRTDGAKQNTEKSSKDNKKDDKRQKNLSVISLPNYNELKLTVVDFEEVDKNQKNSDGNLGTSGKKLNSSAGKLDGISRRCRSFGSLLPQPLKKLKERKAPTDIESDDSFGGLEDWDLALIEHYNPKDASLPRIRNKLKTPQSDEQVISGIEDLIVQEESSENIKKPVPPTRNSESPLKKFNNKNTTQTAIEKSTTRNNTEAISSVNLTPPPSPELNTSQKLIKTNASNKQNEQTIQKTKITDNEDIPFIDSIQTVDEESIEHSSLMRILQEFSVKDKQIKENIKDCNDSLLGFNKNFNMNNNDIEDFLNAEKCNNSDINLKNESSNMHVRIG